MYDVLLRKRQNTTLTEVNWSKSQTPSVLQHVKSHYQFHSVINLTFTFSASLYQIYHVIAIYDYALHDVLEII